MDTDSIVNNYTLRDNNLNESLQGICSAWDSSNITQMRTEINLANTTLYNFLKQNNNTIVAFATLLVNNANNSAWTQIRATNDTIKAYADRTYPSHANIAANVSNLPSHANIAANVSNLPSHANINLNISALRTELVNSNKTKLSNESDARFHTVNVTNITFGNVGIWYNGSMFCGGGC